MSSIKSPIKRVRETLVCEKSRPNQLSECVYCLVCEQYVCLLNPGGKIWTGLI